MNPATKVRIHNWSTVASMGLYGYVGYAIASILSHHPALVTYRIGNVLGYAMTILGVIVLSQVIVDNERYKHLVLEYVAGHFLLALSLSAVGAMFFVQFVHAGPSASLFEGFLLGPAMIFIMVSMFFFFVVVNGTEGRLPWSRHTSITAFGGYLTLVGTALQANAAVRDLMA